MARETKKTPYGQPPLDESVEDFLLSQKGKKAVRRAQGIAVGILIALAVAYYGFMSAVYLYSARTTYGYGHALALLFSSGRRLFREAGGAEKEGRLAEAVVLLKGALREDAQLFAGHVKMGDVHLKLKHPKDALSSYLQANKIDPYNPYVCKRIGRIYIRGKKFARALTYLQKASLLARWDKEVFILLGEAYEGLGEDVEAIEAYETSLIKLPVRGTLQDGVEKRIKRLKAKVYSR